MKMVPGIIFTVLAFVGNGVAASLPYTRQSQNYWSLESFVRTCNDTANACFYSFTINEPNIRSSNCSYTIEGTPATSARVIDYDQVQCIETESSGFSINQGWSPTTKSMTLVVTE